jgi:hypothetical protein
VCWTLPMASGEIAEVRTWARFLRRDEWIKGERMSATYHE